MKPFGFGEALKKLKRIISRLEKKFNIKVPPHALESALCLISDLNGHEKGSYERRRFNEQDIKSAFSVIRKHYI